MTEQNGFREYKTEDVFEIELIHGSPSDLTEVLLKLKPGRKNNQNLSS